MYFSSICVLCVVASMLEHETIQGVLGSKPTGLRKRSTSFPEPAVTVEVLLQRLGLFYTTMSQHGMDSDLIKQVVKQQFYIICAVTLNHLLLRKDMCSWSKGLQIRYDIEWPLACCFYTLCSEIREAEECGLRCVGKTCGQSLTVHTSFLSLCQRSDALRGAGNFQFMLSDNIYQFYVLSPNMKSSEFASLKI